MIAKINKNVVFSVKQLNGRASKFKSRDPGFKSCLCSQGIKKYNGVIIVANNCNPPEWGTVVSEIIQSSQNEALSS